MKHARFFTLFVSVVMLGYGAMGFYFLPIATFQGDLTRMGLLPEKLFGWTKHQPALDPILMQQSSMQEADVLVIGDSFSDRRIWQTALVQKGLKVHTKQWKAVHHAICSDFGLWLNNQRFHGQFVIFEFNERSLLSATNKSVACQQTKFLPDLNTDADRHPPAISFNVNHGEYSGKLSTGIRTLLNVLVYEHLSQSSDFVSWMLPNNVNVARVRNGCELFSHFSCNDVLFLAEDKAEEVDARVLENIEILNSRLSGITPIWVLVPNKSTAFLHPDKQFWNKAEQRFHSPNLLRMTQQAIQEKIVDLYPANNTHFSTTGYLLMGDEIFKAMQHAQPQKPR